MTHQWLTNRARTGWLAGAVAGAAVPVQAYSAPTPYPGH